MNKPRVAPIDLFLLLAMVVSAPVGWFLLNVGLYAQAAMAWGAGAVGVMCALGWNPLSRGAEAREIALAFRMPHVTAPVSIRVVESAGNCFLGYRPGDAWEVNGAGVLSRSLCRPALASLLHRLDTSIALPGGEEDSEPTVCICPLQRGQVAFRMQAA